MHTTENITAKQLYVVPTIVQIKLDSEIALVLESNPPEGPDESKNMKAPEYLENNPFQTMNC